MKLIIFTKGNNTPVVPEHPNLTYQYVRFESTHLDDLLLIAKYRIIHFPMSVIVNDKGVILMKVKGEISESYINNLVESN